MPSEVLSEVLTPARLRTWLEGHAPEAVVGWALCNDICPLARYLRAQADATALVTSDMVLLEDPQPRRRASIKVPLPRWARRFVYGVNAMVIPLERHGELAITREEALSILEWALLLERSTTGD